MNKEELVKEIDSKIHNLNLFSLLPLLYIIQRLSY